MAFTNAPETSTYAQKVIEFTATPNYRNGDVLSARDEQLLNLFYDRNPTENKERSLVLMKRAGLGTTTWSLSKSSPTAALRGHYTDRDTNTFYWAVDNKVYSLSPDVSSTVRTVQTLTTSTGYVGFTDYLKGDTNKRYILFTDGITLYADDYSTTTVTTVTGPPSPHQPYPVSIDGYVFLAKTGTADIYGSDVDDPFTWSTSNMISAEINSDKIIRIHQIKNYLVAFGSSSIEYFWDAANETGSPLSRYDSPVRKIGYVTGLCEIDDVVYFVGQDTKQNIAVYEVKDFKTEVISTPAQVRTLQTRTGIQNAKSQVTLNEDGLVLTSHGHTFYSIKHPDTTWVFDIKDRMWYEWRGAAGGGINIQAAWAMPNGSQYCAVAGQSTISVLSNGLYQDFGQNFTCRYTTEDQRFGTQNWKVCHRLSVIANMHLPAGTVSNAKISWSDNDWSDGGVAQRDVNLFSSSPMIHKCGKFRNRSFRLEYADNYPFFVYGLELDLNVYGV